MFSTSAVAPFGRAICAKEDDHAVVPGSPNLLDLRRVTVERLEPIGPRLNEAVDALPIGARRRDAAHHGAVEVRPRQILHLLDASPQLVVANRRDGVLARKHVDELFGDSHCFRHAGQYPAARLAVVRAG